MRSLFLALLCLLGPVSIRGKEKPATYAIPLPPRADFSDLEWLLGEWAGKTTGREPQGEVHLSVTYDLDQRFMIFREAVSLPATKNAPASKELWMGVLSAGSNAWEFLLRSYSSTGFITRYRVILAGGKIHFNPEGGDQPPPGWLFRRVMARTADSEFDETVQVAPPNKPFFDYYAAKLSRVTNKGSGAAP